MIEKIRPNPYANSLVKRFFDLTMSFLGFLFFSPIIILISLSIKIGSKGPPFFIQKRVGLNGKPFKTIMFRTMYKGAERDQKKYAHLNEADGPVFKINKLVFRRLKINKFVHCFTSPRQQLRSFGRGFAKSA